MIDIKQTSWQLSSDQLSSIRSQVFIQEQHVPIELEWDGMDDDAIHVIALHDDKAIGTARMLGDGHIGRMAVLNHFRGQGIGSRLLLLLLDIAGKQPLQRVYLHAQVNAIAFYKKHGFSVTSDEFMDAGIAHVSMEKIL